MIARLGRQGEPYDLAFGGYCGLPTTPTPANFLNYLVGTGAVGYPAVRRSRLPAQGAAAAKLTGPPRYLAYGKLDVDTSRNDAPWVPIGNASHMTSSPPGWAARFQPVYGMDLAALCIEG